VGPWSVFAKKGMALSSSTPVRGVYAFSWTAEGDPTEHELSFRLA
jgi:hypothetical protein